MSLFCAGDEDQHIYGWRGTTVDHLHRYARACKPQSCLWPQDALTWNIGVLKYYGAFAPPHPPSRDGEL